MPVKDVLSAWDVEEGRGSDCLASKEEGVVANRSSGRLGVLSMQSLKLSLTMDKREQFNTQARTSKSFQKVPISHSLFEKGAYDLQIEKHLLRWRSVTT